MSKPIEGKVAKVVSDHEVAINRGTGDGVRLGMVFEILDASVMDIRDPETNESLGSTHRAKFRVKVTTVEEKFSLARTFKKQRKNVGGMGIGGMASMFEPPKYVTITESFKTDREQNFDERYMLVHEGDPVRQLLVETEDGEFAERAKS